MAALTMPATQATQPSTPNFPGGAIAITDADTTFPQPGTVFVGTTGNVEVIPMYGDASVVFKGIPAGGCVPCLCKGILAAGTTAADMVLVY